jgi:hypothetical protein
MAGLQLGDALGVDVEAQGVKLLAQFNRQRQTDLAEADDGDVEGLRGTWWCYCFDSGLWPFYAGERGKGLQLVQKGMDPRLRGDDRLGGLGMTGGG